jgi:hypothetical protein
MASFSNVVDTQQGISEMQLCHTPAALSAAFDEPNLIACAGLVPAVGLADRIGPSSRPGRRVAHGPRIGEQ